MTRPAARLALMLAAASLVGVLAGLDAGSSGWQLGAWHEPGWSDVVWNIRLPRTLGAWLVGALLGLAGALSQGLFRNPLADPYLLGSSAGAGLAVVLLLAGGRIAGRAWELLAVDLLARFGLVGAAFLGALGGVALTLALARGAERSTALLLAGVVVGVVLGAVADLVTLVAPEALRGKQVFMLGSTSFLGWGSCAVLALVLAFTLPLAWRFSRALDALTLGEDSARSLGLPLPRVRALLVALLALATGAAVAQSGLVAFVGLVAPHLVRRRLPSRHGVILLASSAAGGVLLLASDLLSRSLLAPEELPVGLTTAALGGCFLLWLMRRRGGTP